VCCWLWTLCHTTQHGAVLIIFPLNLQTITITRMLSSGGEGEETVQDRRYKLLLVINRKWYMNFRLVPKSVTLNDLKRRNDFGSFPGALRKSGCRYTDTFCGRIFIAIFAKVTENECVMHRRSHVTDCHHYNITYSLLLSNANLILPWWFFCNLPLTLNGKCCYFVVRHHLYDVVVKIHVRCLISRWALFFI